MHILKYLLFSTTAAVVFASQQTLAQGCVAAHTNQRTLSELVRSEDSFVAPFWIHNLSVDIGYRVFSSNKYFQGSDEIARSTAVRNHQNIFDIGVQYRLSPRWSLIADVPVFDGTRNQFYPPPPSGLQAPMAQCLCLRPGKLPVQPPRHKQCAHLSESTGRKRHVCHRSVPLSRRRYAGSS